MHIEYTTKKAAEADLKELEELTKPLHRNRNNKYSEVVRHPIKALYRISITLVGVYKNPVEEWITNKGLELKETTSDWTVKE